MIARAALVFLFSALVPALTAAEAPRYRWAPDRQFVYEVHITAHLPSKVETLEGRIAYQVKSAGEPLKIGYRGGLTKTAKNKPGASSNRADPFGPARFPPLPPPGPFSRRVEPFQGLIQTSNEVTLTDRGEILALEGTSQLPYLLGNLSLLVFERLPASDQASWKVESGVLITEKSEERRRGFDPFASDPFFSRRSSNKPEKTNTGERASSFTREKEAGPLVTYAKTYRLHSPGDGESVTIEGTGRWTFNRELGMAESLEFQQKLTIEEGNVSLAIPVTIKYRRLSDEEWARIEADRLAAEQKRKEEQERMAAEAKAKAESPLAPAERQQTLAALAKGSRAELEAALKLLAGKSPRTDEELARAIKPHVSHDEEAVQDLAKKALAAFSPDYKRSYDLNRIYRDTRAVKELGPWISYDAPLPPGLIVAANRYGMPEDQYYPALVVDTASSGLVKVKYIGGSLTGDRLREDMFLPPREVEQSRLDASQRAAVDAYCDDVERALGDSPDEAKRIDELNRAYRDTKTPVPERGAPLPDGVKLPKFLVVAAQKNDGKWYQAHVSGELEDGRVAVRFSGDPWDAKLPRASVRLPPAEVKAINLPPITPTAAAPTFRTWSDATGQFTIRAKYAGEQGANVRLLREDGQELSVPLARLSDVDLRYVQQQRAPAAVNPFAQ